MLVTWLRMPDSVIPDTQSLDKSALPKQLYELRRESFAGVRPQKVPDLLKIARRLVPDGELSQQLESSVELAIGDLKADQEIALLWFGLHKDTRGKDKAARTQAAAEARFVSVKGFEVHIQRRLIDEICEALVTRHAAATQPPPLKLDHQQTAKPHRPPQGWRWRLRPDLRGVGRTIFIAVLAAGAGVATILWSLPAGVTALDPSKEVPPTETVLNARDGSVIQRPNKTPSQQLGFISDYQIFRACNLSTVEGRCQFPPPPEATAVNPGNVLLLGLSVRESGEAPLPFVTFVARRRWASNHSAQVEMVVDWPGESRKLVPQPVKEKLTFVLPGTYGYLNLVYLPGSTELRGPDWGHFVAHLPDGIMEGGIALANLGPPVSCFKCFDGYKRYIFFKVRVRVYDKRS